MPCQLTCQLTRRFLNHYILLGRDARHFLRAGQRTGQAPARWCRRFTLLTEFEKQSRSDGPDDVMITLGHCLTQQKSDFEDVRLVAMVNQLLVIRRGRANTLLVAKLDRLSRSLRDVCTLVDELFSDERYHPLSLCGMANTHSASSLPGGRRSS